MRTIQSYSSPPHHARGQIRRFCTGGHYPKFLGDSWSGSGGNFAGPLLRLPVEGRNFFGIQMKALRNLGRRIPLAALVGQNELEDRTQLDRTAEQNRFG